jgi:hypothetical protein
MVPDATMRWATRSSRAYARLVVGILWVVVMLNYADRQAMFSLFPLLRKDLHASDGPLGSMSSICRWIYAGIPPFAGYVGARLRGRDIILGLGMVERR